MVKNSPQPEELEQALRPFAIDMYYREHAALRRWMAVLITR